MKKIILFFGFLSIIQNLFSQTDPNILIGLDNPSYGIKIKTNWPGGSGGWSRAFSLVNQNDTESFIKFGGYGDINNGVSSFVYGYVGREYNDTFMVFKPNGNIGIGTTSPSVKLDVSGKVYFRSTSDYQLRVEGLDSWAGIQFKDINSTSNIFYHGEHGTFGIGSGSNVANKKLHADGGTSIGVAYRHQSVPVNGLAIEGNVGIGTSKSYSKLSFGSADANSNSRIAFYEHTGDGTRFRGIGMANPDPANFVYGVGIWALTGPVSPTDTNMSMFIGDSGNVGIGTTSPTAGLEVRSNEGIKIESVDNIGWKASIRMADGLTNTLVKDDMLFSTSGGFMFKMDDNNNGVSNIQGFNIYDRNNNSVFTVREFNGNIGIGTTNPKQKLSLKGNLSIGNTEANDNSWGEFLIKKVSFGVNYASLGFSEGTSTNNTNVENAITIQRTGNVGIGTSTPASNLHLKGGVSNGEPSATAIFRIDTNSSSNNIGIKFGAQNGNGADAYAWIDAVESGVGNNKNLILNPFAGNVGIGTTAPDAKLAVNGIIHSKEVKVDLVGWPDYVFKKEYDLLSIEEVEIYIEKNGHLPKMPSAKEVEKEGILLGEMNKKLLEKIEELTLYTIQQEKEINDLKTEKKKLQELMLRVAKLEKAAKK